MADANDMILPLLREMRAENDLAHKRTHARLDKLEEQMVSFRQAISADSLLSKLVTGDFEERIEKLEQRVRELEGRN